MLETAIHAASAAGKLLRKNFGNTQAVDLIASHDIKLKIDRESQELITSIILADYPDHGVLGEEGASGIQNAEVRWVVDPLDGTVNYFYGIPIYAVSIAVQQRVEAKDWQTVAAVVFAPELQEMFATERGAPAMLHGRPIHVSDRSNLDEAVLAIGFFKSAETIRRTMKDFQQLVPRVRKVRILGAAALNVCYVAAGRFDGFIEHGLKIWDIAAGLLILENAGGRADVRPADEPNTFNARLWNGKLSLDSAAKLSS